MKLNVKSMFDKAILERGQGYYRQGRVSNVLKSGDDITACVQGTNRYKVRVNLSKKTFHCNCPYEGRMCKHLAAVCYELNSRKKLKTVDTIEKQCANKSKEELVRILGEILAENPEFHVYLLSEQERLHKRIFELDESGEEWQEPYEFIPEHVSELIDEIDGRPGPLLSLLEKVFSIHREHEDYEDEVFFVIDELKKATLDVKQAREVEQKAKRILGKEYDEFMKGDEDEQENE